MNDGDDRTLRHNFFGDLNARSDHSAGIFSQIEHKRLHVLSLELVERGFELLAGLLAERRNSNVADPIVKHLIGDGLDVDDVALDRVNRISLPFATDQQINVRTRLAANFDRNLVGENLIDGNAVDRKDTIARLQSRVGARRIGHDRNDMNVAVLKTHVDADAAERAAGIRFNLIVETLIEINRMRIAERMNHAPDGAVDHLGVVDRLNVILLDEVHRREQSRKVGGSTGIELEHAADAGDREDRGEQRRQHHKQNDFLLAHAITTLIINNYKG